MANEFYISAGLPATGNTPTSNSFFIDAGLLALSTSYTDASAVCNATASCTVSGYKRSSEAVQVSTIGVSTTEFINKDNILNFSVQSPEMSGIITLGTECSFNVNIPAQISSFFGGSYFSGKTPTIEFSGIVEIIQAGSFAVQSPETIFNGSAGSLFFGNTPVCSGSFNSSQEFFASFIVKSSTTSAQFNSCMASTYAVKTPVIQANFNSIIEFSNTFSGISPVSKFNNTADWLEYKFNVKTPSTEFTGNSFFDLTCIIDLYTPPTKCNFFSSIAPTVFSIDNDIIRFRRGYDNG